MLDPICMLECLTLCVCLSLSLCVCLSIWVCLWIGVSLSGFVTLCLGMCVWVFLFVSLCFSENMRVCVCVWLRLCGSIACLFISHCLWLCVRVCEFEWWCVIYLQEKTERCGLLKSKYIFLTIQILSLAIWWKSARNLVKFSTILLLGRNLSNFLVSPPNRAMMSVHDWVVFDAGLVYVIRISGSEQYCP